MDQFSLKELKEAFVELLGDRTEVLINKDKNSAKVYRDSISCLSKLLIAQKQALSKFMLEQKEQAKQATRPKKPKKQPINIVEVESEYIDYTDRASIPDDDFNTVTD